MGAPPATSPVTKEDRLASHPPQTSRDGAIHVDLTQAAGEPGLGAIYETRRDGRRKQRSGCPHAERARRNWRHTHRTAPPTMNA